MSIAARVRVTMARRPWIRWVSVVVLALGAAQLVHNTNADLARARARWGTTATVFVADRPLVPGDPVTAEARDLPLIAIPAGAVDADPDGTPTRRHLAPGQVVTSEHLAGGDGPTALAEPGEVIVPVSVSAAPPPTGTRLLIVAEGIPLTDRATVVGKEGDVVWVALPVADAPVVADAVRRDLATLLLVP